MNECKIVEDLLPLYIEELTSEETGSFVKEHLDGCESCRAVHERMTAPVQQEAQKVDYRKTLWISVLKIVGQVLLSVAVVAGLLLYGLWETGWLNRETIESPDGQQRFVVYDTGAGFFGSGAYIETPDGRERNLKGDESYRDFHVWFSPDSQKYFVWVEFDDHDETYLVNEAYGYEYLEDEIAFGYENTYYPAYEIGERDFLGVLREILAERFGYESVSFRFMRWSDDSRGFWFGFEPEHGYSGAVFFDCEEKRISAIIEHEPQLEIVE